MGRTVTPTMSLQPTSPFAGWHDLVSELLAAQLGIPRLSRFEPRHANPMALYKSINVRRQMQTKIGLLQPKPYFVRG